MMKESPKFQTFVENTSTKRSEQEPVIRDIAKDFNQVTKNFLGYLTRRPYRVQEAQLSPQDYRPVYGLHQAA
jgi:F0F1-type ATP synthase delta subunit